MITIETNVANVADKLLQISKQLDLELDGLIHVIMIRALYETQENIRSQGRRFGNPWEPPSKWIQAKKGDGYKILEGQERNLRLFGAGLDMQLVFVSPGNWTITEHHEGFREGATLQYYTISLKSPAALGLPGNANNFKFRWGRDSVVPRRKIWMTESEALQMIHPLVEDFRVQMEARIR